MSAGARAQCSDSYLSIPTLLGSPSNLKVLNNMCMLKTDDFISPQNLHIEPQTHNQLMSLFPLRCLIRGSNLSCLNLNPHLPFCQACPIFFPTSGSDSSILPQTLVSPLTPVVLSPPAAMHLQILSAPDLTAPHTSITPPWSKPASSILSYCNSPILLSLVSSFVLLPSNFSISPEPSFKNLDQIVHPSVKSCDGPQVLTQSSF